jgi:hypothetical protein
MVPKRFELAGLVAAKEKRPREESEAEEKDREGRA